MLMQLDERLVGGCDDGEFVDVMIDSGAVVSVVPKDFAPQVPLDTRDTKPYYSVQGLPIEHFGSRNVPIELETGDDGVWKVEATNSRKFIMSVAKSVENGASVTFTRDGGFLHKPGKASVPLRRHGDLYYMRIKLKKCPVPVQSASSRLIAPIAPQFEEFDQDHEMAELAERQRVELQTQYERDNEQREQLHEDPRDMLEAQALPVPNRPSAAVVAQHMIHLIPYADWCEIVCRAVASRATTSEWTLQ